MVRKIFFIEDNRTEVMLLRLAFGGLQNIDVHYFTTGEELLKHLHEQPEIVVVDMLLPDIDGLELIRKLKAHNQDVEVVVLSAQEKIEVVAETQKAGVFNYIVKNESSLKYLRKVLEHLLILLDIKEANRSASHK